MLASKDQYQVIVDLFSSGNRLEYKKGEYIIRPGQAPTGVFLILSGLVKAYNISKYGEENLLIIRKAHEVFPLIWAVTGQERDIIYEALTTASVLYVHREEFMNKIENKPEALRAILDMVTEMYRIHSERLINLGYRTVRERLISFLLIMSQRFGRKTSSGILIDVPLRHQDIASSINATRETTSREMIYLERHGLLTGNNSYITLKDILKLRAHL